jgi:hypothetical protein
VFARDRATPVVPERTIGTRISGSQPSRLTPRAPVSTSTGPGPGGPDLGAVQPGDPTPSRGSGPAVTTVRTDPGRIEPPLPGQSVCPGCGRGVDAGRRFCRCGAALTPPARPTTVVAAKRLPWYRRLGEIFGGGRDFKRAMRAANGGLRATYDVGLSARSMVWRASAVLAALGVGLSQFGPWGADLRTQLTAKVDGFLPHSYADISTDAVSTDPAQPPTPGFDPRYAVDGDAARAWAAPWVPVAAGGAPCQRPGGTPALTITFKSPAAVDRIVVRAGLAKGNDKRALQARPRRLDILFSDGSCKVADLADDAEAQTVDVAATGVAHARIVIVDAYPPSDQGDGLVSLSEIAFQTRRGFQY